MATSSARQRGSRRPFAGQVAAHALGSHAAALRAGPGPRATHEVVIADVALRRRRARAGAGHAAGALGRHRAAAHRGERGRPCADRAVHEACTPVEGKRRRTSAVAERVGCEQPTRASSRRRSRQSRSHPEARRRRERGQFRAALATPEASSARDRALSGSTGPFGGGRMAMETRAGQSRAWRIVAAGAPRSTWSQEDGFTGKRLASADTATISAMSSNQGPSTGRHRSPRPARAAASAPPPEPPGPRGGGFWAAVAHRVAAQAPRPYLRPDPARENLAGTSSIR